MKFIAILAENTSRESIGSTEYFINLENITEFHGGYNRSTSEDYIRFTLSCGQSYDILDHTSMLKFCKAVGVSIKDVLSDK